MMSYLTPPSQNLLAPPFKKSSKGSVRNEKKHFRDESVVPRGVQGEERAEEEEPKLEAAGHTAPSTQKSEAGSNPLRRELLTSHHKER